MLIHYLALYYMLGQIVISLLSTQWIVTSCSQIIVKTFHHYLSYLEISH